MLNNKQKKAIKLFNESRDNLNLAGLELVNDFISSENTDPEKLLNLKETWELSVQILSDIEQSLYDIKSEDKE